jgi:hypothetical protein
VRRVQSGGVVDPERRNDLVRWKMKDTRVIADYSTVPSSSTALVLPSMDLCSTYDGFASDKSIV